MRAMHAKAPRLAALVARWLLGARACGAVAARRAWARRRVRRQRRQRPADSRAALRQPEVRPGQLRQGPGTELSRSLGSSERAGLPVEIIQRVRGLAAGARRGAARWAGCYIAPAQQPAYRAGAAVGGEGRARRSRRPATLRDDDSESAARHRQRRSRRARQRHRLQTAAGAGSRVGNYRGYIEQSQALGHLSATRRSSSTTGSAAIARRRRVRRD